MENVITERVWKYTWKVYKMDDCRWLKVCLREEVRAIMNRNPSEWGKKMVESAREVGVGCIFEEMWNGETLEKIRRIIENGVLNLERDWVAMEKEKIKKSTYHEWYQDIAPVGRNMNY